MKVIDDLGVSRTPSPTIDAGSLTPDSLWDEPDWLWNTVLGWFIMFGMLCLGAVFTCLVWRSDFVQNTVNSLWTKHTKRRLLARKTSTFRFSPANTPRHLKA